MTLTNRFLFGTTIIWGCAATVLLAPSGAHAQTPAASVESSNVEELVVTGTRLQLPEFSLSQPVTTVGQEELEAAGVTSVGDFIKEVPALTNSTNLQDSTAAANARVGLSFLNLRNLGPERTLVLIDGRRHVAASTASAAVDTNTIPVGLIERIDVLTGGASAVYGADGVTGVVNFILKKDFEGVDARVQHGWTQDGGAATTYGSILFGENFAGGRASFTLGGEFSFGDPLHRDQRAYTALGRRLTLVENPEDIADGDDDPDLVDNIFATNARYIDSSGVYTDGDFGDSLSGLDFELNGNPWRDGIYAGGFTMLGGSGTPRESYVNNIIAGLDRYSVNGSFRYELAPGHRFFAEGKFVRTKTHFDSQPTFDFAASIPLDNPYMPDSIRADASGPDGLGRVFVARDNFDLGFLGADIERDTWRSVVGFEGELGSNLNYEVSYVYGHTGDTTHNLNDRITDRWYAAIDTARDPVSGAIVCRSNFDPTRPRIPGSAPWAVTFTPGPNSGCVPVNVFGADTISAEARNWINAETVNRSEISQHVVTGYVSGDTSPWFSLPAGPVSFVVGGEYRREASDFVPDPLLARSAELGVSLSWFGQARRTQGEFDVAEVFAEASVPLLADLPMLKSLRLDAAYRYSNYSTSGGADTWKIGGQWRVNDSLMFRGTLARAVRAPSISDLFTPQIQTSAGLNDPCDKDNVNLGRNPSARLQNCRAALAPLGLDPLTFDNTNSAVVFGTTGGNPNLEPEVADTKTIGVVFTPSFVKGLSIALDYYDIELANAINFFSAQSVVDNCFDLPQPNPFCDGLTRDTDTNPNNRGRINGFRRFGQNVASYTTKGFDLSVVYQLDPARLGIDRDIGLFRFALIGSKLDDLTFTEVTGATPDNRVGEEGAPEWQASFDLTWLYDNWTVNYGFQWADSVIRFPDTYDVEPDFVADQYKFFSARFTHDINVSYDMDNGATLYAGINNFTNQEPDPGSLLTPISALGRFFYVGAKLKLGSIPGL